MHDTVNRIVIDEAFCKGCQLCVDQCPQAVYEPGQRRNAKGYRLPEVVRPEACVACRLCEMLCPDLAITVKEAQDET